MAESLAEFFLANFQAHREERAYGQRRGYRMEWFTYGQVLEMAFRFVGDLEARGICKGERVMLWGENCAEWVAAFFGGALGAVIVVPMDDGASADFAGRVAGQVEARLWVCSRKHAQGAGEAGAPRVILEDLSQIAGGTPALLSDSQMSIGRDDILQIVFTSGTTAEPKGVVITHGNVLANIAPLEQEMQRYLKYTIRRERVSVLVSVPRVLQSLKQKIERDLEDGGKIDDFRRRFRSSEPKHFVRRWWIFRDIRRQFGWKFLAFICGGAALDAETEEFWGRLGYAAIQGYGLTETTSLISVNHPFKLGKGSIGKVLPGREVKLAEDGEILIRGGGVAAGYWDKGGQQRVVDKEGWYRTGDVGALDEAGNLYFKGRKKEVIVTPGGLNIYPEDLEAALRRQPEVKDCVVVGIERTGNAEPCAVVIVRDDARVAGVVERANRELPEFQRMRMWVRWPQQDFPRTNTEKPRRNVIAQFAAREMLQGGKKEVASESPVMEMIGRITGRSAAELRPEAALDTELGLSSLDRVELISALEDRYHVDLSEASFSAARTVGDVERMIRGEARERPAYHYPRWVLRWPVTWVRWLAQYLLMVPAMFFLGRPRIEGRQNLRGEGGPLLVVCNHISDVDFAFVQTALPVRLRNSIAIATRGEALEALRTPAAGRNFLGKLFDRVKWMLGVEGRHTVDGKVNPFRAGIGLLANNLGIPVLPMRIVGMFEVKQAGRKFARAGEIRVLIGRPVSFEPGTDPERIARELQKKVEEL